MIEVTLVMSNAELMCVEFETREAADEFITGLLEKSPDPWEYDPATNHWECAGRAIVINDRPSTPEELEELKRHKIAKMVRLRDKAQETIDKQKVKVGRITSKLTRLESEA